MRVLLVHDAYGSAAPSGENVVFENERRMLAAAEGYEIQTYVRNNEDLLGDGLVKKLSTALTVPWNSGSLREVRKAMLDFRADIIHVHNTFPQLSPAVLNAAKNTDVRLVTTLHNYRMFCVAGNHGRGGHVCTECYDRAAVWPGVTHRCFRKSYAASIAMAAMLKLHAVRRTWTTGPDGVIAQTKFQRDRLIQRGFDPERVFVKPHFCATPTSVRPWRERELKAVFVGRVSREKGIFSLLEAWRQIGAEGPTLEVIGDGPALGAARCMAEEQIRGRVRFRGLVSDRERDESMASARLLIMPTEWFETFWMVIIEAFSHGTPVLASRMSCIPEVVDDGRTGTLVDTDPRSLARAIETLWADQEGLARMGAAAREEHLSRYTAKVNIELLSAIYERVIKRAKTPCSS